MPGDEREHLTQVEWVDFGPSAAPADDVIGARPPRRRWWWAAGAAAAVLLGLVVIGQGHRGGEPTAAASSASPAPTVDQSVTEPPAVTPPQVANRGQALLNVPTGWELFGQGATGVVRVQLAQGVVTTTTVPTGSRSGALSFVVGPNSAVVRAYNGSSGFVVPDGQAAQPTATGPLGNGGAIPGPDASHFWTITAAGAKAVLIDFEGHITGPTLAIPTGTNVVADGSGYLMFSATSGVYDLRPAGLTRITTGQVLAVGPNGWLVSECDAQYVCASYLVSQRTGERRIITGLPADTIFDGSGVISGDGAYAAVLQPGPGGTPSVHLIDLATGRNRDTGLGVTTTDASAFPTTVWSPDSRWLFVAGTQRLLALNVGTGQVTDLGVNAHITQVALRVA